MSAPRQWGSTNGLNPDPGHRRGNSNAGNGLSQEERSRADLFESEKRRIIDSCFTKKEEDGAFAESYITHIPVWEDSASPSSPPPPTSPEDNKKPRVIIVAVRRSGRVRLHKARENSNKSFSIGKTWLLDHLTAIESFSGSIAKTPEEQLRKEWAGDTGMLITIQKPYFWKAHSAKEKEFFIGSLVKIFRKYTGGKEPELTGFTQQQLLELSPAGAPRPKTPQTSTSRPSVSSSASKPPVSDFQSAFPPASTNGLMRPPSSGSASLRTTDSHDRIPALPGQYPPDTPRSLKPQDSRSRFQSRDGSFSTGDGSLASAREGLQPSARADDKGRLLDPASSTESFNTSRQEAQTPPGLGPPDRLRNGAYSPLTRVETPPEIPVPGPRSPERSISSAKKAGFSSSPSKQDALPERRRPPLITPDPSQTSTNYNSTSTYSKSEEQSVTADTRQSTSNGFLSEPPKRSAVEATAPAVDQNKSSDGNKDVPPAIASLMSPTEPSSEPESPAVMDRPGLGSFIKKKDSGMTARSKMNWGKAKAAATTVNVLQGFQSRKLRTEVEKPASDSDGINGVFKPAPLKQEPPRTPLSMVSDTVTSPQPDAKREPQEIMPKIITPSSTEEAPRIKETVVAPQAAPPSKEEPAPPVPEERKKKRPSNHAATYAKILGIDLVVLEGRTAEIELELADLGWVEEEKKKKILSEDMQIEVRKDLAKAETGTWLSSFENGDERVGAVAKMLDKAIAECDELEGVLMLYNAELGTLNEDVNYIEGQAQGLQVNAANQRLLHTELQKLLQTISISSSQLRALQDASLAEPEEVQQVETALSQLYKAMLTIDPKLRTRGRPVDALSAGESAKSSGGIGMEVSAMRAVQEKKEGYRAESVDFILRLKNHMNKLFEDSRGLLRTSSERKPRAGLPTADTKIDLTKRDAARAGLWMYSPLMLFTREIDSFEWDSMLKAYERTLKRFYQDEYRETFMGWKGVARKPSGEEQDLLFTTQEKESESLVGRKLTVKRSKTLREAPRTPSSEKAQDGKINGYEAFAGALFDTASSVFMEQNFISDMFHVSSLDSTEFPDLVASVPPQARRGGDLMAPRQFDPDRNLAKKLQNLMEDIFSFWPAEVQGLVDWVISQDPLQGVGVLFALESKYTELEESNQEYIVNTLQQIHGRLATRFERFVDEQIRGIEDTKVRIKKRKGVIAFIKTFPYFASTVENMLPAPRADAYEVRQMVNNVYNRLNKAMFESLKFIAKESPVVMAGQKAPGQTSGDAEDKEILNYHILLIENMHHYVEEVDARTNPVLADWKKTATQEMAEHTELYLDAVVRRPLGKLLDSLESTEALMKVAEAAGEAPSSIAEKPSHSKAIFRKVLYSFDAKEVRHGIEALKKRVDKHFGNADDPELSRKLVLRILRECEDRYLAVLDRTQKIVREVYEGQLEAEFKREDIVAAFRR